MAMLGHEPPENMSLASVSGRRQCEVGEMEMETEAAETVETEETEAAETVETEETEAAETVETEETEAAVIMETEETEAADLVEKEEPAQKETHYEELKAEVVATCSEEANQ